MTSQGSTLQAGAVGGKTPWLYYVDWLRVIAILMVFTFHAVHPFDFSDWHIKNIEQSEVLSIILSFLGMWACPSSS